MAKEIKQGEKLIPFTPCALYNEPITTIPQMTHGDYWELVVADFVRSAVRLFLEGNKQDALIYKKQADIWVECGQANPNGAYRFLACIPFDK